jgi:phosphodiesterase/alkaline phosphatase D-like protein
MEGGPLKEWGDHIKPKHRAQMPATPELTKDIDQWYFENYCGWYSREEIKAPLASIPAVNMWDDHDIIDGFGSYPDRWMRAPIFEALGRSFLICS